MPSQMRRLLRRPFRRLRPLCEIRQSKIRVVGGIRQITQTSGKRVAQYVPLTIEGGPQIVLCPALLYDTQLYDDDPICQVSCRSTMLPIPLSITGFAAFTIASSLSTNRLRQSSGKLLSVASCGSTSDLRILANMLFAVPCSPRSASSGYGGSPLSAARSQAIASWKSSSVLTFKKARRSWIDAPASGNGRALIQGVRRKRTAGASVDR